MADDLSLLLKIKAENTQATNKIAETRTAITGLRTHLAGEMQNLNTVTQGVFGELEKHLNVFVGEKIPLLGGAFIKVTENVKGMGKEVENVEGGLASLGGAAGVATIAVTALGAAVVGLGVAMFEIVKKSAEAGLELEHLIEKTGLSATTITSLKFAAEQSGQSIEGFDVGMKLFANNVAKAAEGSDKAAEALKRLGITPRQALTDLDGTLAIVFKKIYDAPPGIEKMSLAADAFGRRMGANLIPLIESFHGNLGELIERAKELGVTLDDEGVKSLADFERNMKTLQAQALGLERVFAVELAPTLSHFLEQLSQLLSENRQAFAEWGSFVADVMRGVAKVANSEIGTIIYWISRLSLEVTGIPGAIRSLGQLGGTSTSTSGLSQFTSRFLNRVPATAAHQLSPFNRGALGTALDNQDIDTGKAARDKISAAQKLLNELTDEYNKLLAKGDENAREQVVAQELLKDKYKNTSAALRDQIIQEAKLIDVKTAVIKAEKDAQESLKRSTALTSEWTQRIAESRGTVDQYELEINKLIDGLKGLTTADKEDIRTALEHNAAILRTLELTRQRIVLTQTLIDRMERERAVTDEIRDRLIGIDHAQGDETRPRSVFATIQSSASAIQRLHDGLSGVFSGSQLKGAQAGIEALSGAFEGLGQAIGQVVQAWVLYGNAGTSVRKVTAEILAGVAQQAAIKAVFELAEGFATLAMAFFGIPNAGPSASAHFAAAAIYGSIAGVAAVAGRGVAGSAFANQGAGGSAGSGAGTTGGSGTGTSHAPSPITLGSQRTPVLHITFENKAGALFNTHIVNAVAKDASNGGVTRDVIVKEINRQS